MERDLLLMVVDGHEHRFGLEADIMQKQIVEGSYMERLRQKIELKTQTPS